jgi:hypothetical protein
MPLPLISAVWMNRYRYVPEAKRKYDTPEGSGVTVDGGTGTVMGGALLGVHATLAAQSVTADIMMCRRRIA